MALPISTDRDVLDKMIVDGLTKTPGKKNEEKIIPHACHVYADDILCQTPRDIDRSKNLG